MKTLTRLALTFALLVTTALANTEKVIFQVLELRGSDISAAQLGELQLESLSLRELSLQTRLAVVLPSEEQPQGVDHWFTLEDLTEHQRYELRLCWAATQPSEFWLNVYNVSEVFDTPHLVQSLARYSEQRIAASNEPEGNQIWLAVQVNVLFLRVRAAADYFTTNKTLMLEPSPVDIELILDPYTGGVFPESLTPTAIYIVVVASVAWLASSYCWKLLTPSTSKIHAD